MRRLASLAFLLILGAPAISRAQVCDFLVCSPVMTPSGLKEQAIFYYHIDTSSPPFTLQHEYLNGFVILPNGQLCERVIHEFRLPVVLSACQKGHLAFEATLGVQVGPVIQGELSQLLDASGLNVVGTVWIDKARTGKEARGAVIGTQKYYHCSSPGQPNRLLVQNLSLFNPGFDSEAIDNATRPVIRQEWTSPIQGQIDAAAVDHILSSGTCTEISLEDYGALLMTPGASCAIEYDFGDPTAIAIGIPPD